MPNLTTEKAKLNSIRTSGRLSRPELSLGGDTSFEVYYRDGSVGVPFLWESQPGTPKIRSRQSPLPPLTPPPSYLSNSFSRKPGKKHSPKSNLVPTLLLNFKKTQSPPQLRSPSTPSSYSSTSTPSSVPSSPFRCSGEFKERRFSSPRMSFDSRFERSRIEADGDSDESPVSTLCFRAGSGANGRSRGCSSNIIKLLLREFS